MFPNKGASNDGCLLVLVALAGVGSRAPLYSVRVLLPLLVFFVIIVRESTVSRASDEQIVAWAGHSEG